MAVFPDGDVVEVGKVATQTAVPECIALEREGSVGTDGEARGDWPLHGTVELKLVVGDDFTGAMILIGKDTVLQADDGVGGANGFTLSRDILGDIVGSYLKGTVKVLVTAVGSLT